MTGATPDGVPVAAGAGDQAAGALGVGVDRPGPASVVLGTSGVVRECAAGLRGGPGSAPPGLLPRGARAAGSRWG